ERAEHAEFRWHVSGQRLELSVAMFLALGNRKRHFAFDGMRQVLVTDANATGEPVVREDFVVAGRLAIWRLLAGSQPERHLSDAGQLRTANLEAVQIAGRALAGAVGPRTGFRGVERLRDELDSIVEIRGGLK